MIGRRWGGILVAKDGGDEECRGMNGCGKASSARGKGTVEPRIEPVQWVEVMSGADGRSGAASVSKRAASTSSNSSFPKTKAASPPLDGRSFPPSHRSVANFSFNKTLNSTFCTSHPLQTREWDGSPSRRRPHRFLLQNFPPTPPAFTFAHRSPVCFFSVSNCPKALNCEPPGTRCCHC
jgi:hypothetical protein